MKTTTKTLFVLSALAGFSLTTAQAALVTWTDGGPGEDWSTSGNWGGDPIPVSGTDSVSLTERNVLNYDFTVASSQSITDSVTTDNWFGLANSGWGTVANLTLATGGTIDVYDLAARGSVSTDIADAPTFTIQDGASLTRLELRLHDL